MNKDHVEGTAKDIGGKVKEELGRATGDRKTQREGLADQAEGEAQKAKGDVKDVLRGDRGGA